MVIIKSIILLLKIFFLLIILIFIFRFVKPLRKSVNSEFRNFFYKYKF
jgi:hypothetical protein